MPHKYKCFNIVNRAPAKKPAPARKAATASGSTGAKKERVGADGVSRPKPKQQGNPAVEGQEPTWELGWNKKVKVSKLPVSINHAVVR